MTDPSQARSSAKTDRDRFVAFSFAAADVLLEMDAGGTVSYVSGASSRLSNTGDGAVLSRPFIDHVVHHDRVFVGEVLKRIEMGGKMEPVTICLHGRDGAPVSAVLGGCRLPTNPESTYLTVTFLSPGLGQADERVGFLPDRAEFETVMERKLHQAVTLGQNVSLTYLTMEGLAAYQRQGDALSVDRLLSNLTGYLRAQSLGGDGVGAIDDERYAIMHGRELKGAVLQDRASEIARREAGDTISVVAETVTLDGGSLSEADAVRALLYSLRQFESQDGGDLKFDSVIDATRKTLQMTMPKIAEVRSIIQSRGFDVVFQPIVEINSGEIHHFEALSRIKGFPSVQEFIIFIEDTGLIEEFDLAVLELVLKNLNQQAETEWHPHVAVNLSARSISSESFLPALNRTLIPHRRLLPQILFELTETVMIRDFAAANRRVQELRRLGNKVCMDDVGAGGTSFQSLQSIEVDYAKIDGSMIKGAQKNAQTRRLLESVMQYCEHAKVSVIAEFIETDEDEALAREFGIGFGQGNRYGKGRADYRQAYAAHTV